MNRARVINAIVAVAALAGCETGLGGNDAESAAPTFPACTGGGQKVTIGVGSDQPGWAQRDGDQIVGFDVAAACHVAKQVYGDEVSVTWTQQAHPHLLVDDGEADFATNTHISSEKAGRVLVSDPYLRTSFGVLVSKDSPIKDSRDLSRLAVCMTQGRADTIESLYYTERPSFASVVIGTDLDHCFNAMRSGKADGVFDVDADLAGTAAYGGHKGKYRVISLFSATTDQRFAIQTGDGELRDKINAAIAKMHADGTWQKLVDKWFGRGGYQQEFPAEPLNAK